MNDDGSRCEHGTPMCAECRAVYTMIVEHGRSRPDYNPPSEGSPDRLVHDEMVKVMRDLARRVGAAMPPGVCFAMFIFQSGPGGWCTYISSAERAGVLASLKEFIAREEAK